MILEKNIKETFLKPLRMYPIDFVPWAQAHSNDY
jgi:hypothetical protein